MDKKGHSTNKKLFIANWKSNKTEPDIVNFFEGIKEKILQIDLADKTIIIAPPFTQLAKCKYLIDANNLPVGLAAQNVSSFPSGAYTGEVNAKQVKEYADFVIVGHSERRKYMHESETDIENKIREAIESGLTVIQCIQDENSIIHTGAEIIAYEPPTAIGSGNPDSPEHVEQVFAKILEENPDIRVLYGGSVNADNVQNFLKIEKLSGFLIGGASLEADSFLSLLSW